MEIGIQIVSQEEFDRIAAAFDARVEMAAKFIDLHTGDCVASYKTQKSAKNHAKRLGLRFAVKPPRKG